MCGSILSDCHICGKQFKSYKSKPRKFCSTDCYRNPAAKELIKAGRVKTLKGSCLNCSAEIYESRSGKSKFCNRNCYDAYRVKKWESRKVICHHCGKDVIGAGVSAGDQIRKFCSAECRYESKRPKPKTCKVCNCYFSAVKLHHIEDGSKRYSATSSNTCCSHECRKEFYRTDEHRKEKIGSKFRKELHPNWKGGGKDRGYRGHGWNKIAEKCRELHGRKCAHCGISEEDHGRKLEVNHIMPFHQCKNKSKANDQSNLEALCKSCHTTADRKWSRENPVQFSLDIFT